MFPVWTRRPTSKRCEEDGEMLLKDNTVFVPVKNPNLSPVKTPMPAQAPDERIRNYSEVSLGYTQDQALTESERCLKCPGRYCAQSCPAHVPVTEFIAQVRAGNYQAAYELISTRNAFPAITGRVCAQEKQCERDCTRGIRGESVAIGRLESFVADWHAAHGAPLPCAPANGIPVAVAGSGPAGLSCADFLSRAGFSVTVMEARSYLGGIPVYGIPGFVLPNSIVEQKVEELRSRGVEFRTGVKVGTDISVDRLCEEYRGVFVATGASRPVMPDIAGETAPGVFTANDYLEAANVKGCPIAGENVVILGGGNTAVDAARCAVRSGASRVTIVYRRSAEEIPARREELLHAAEEGVSVVYMAAPDELLCENGRLSGLVCRKTVLTAPDYPGGRKGIELTDERFTIPADTAVLALGYTTEPIPGLKTNDRGLIVVDRDTLATSEDGVYAGGDAVTGANTLVHAMAAGRKAAEILAEKLGTVR